MTVDQKLDLIEQRPIQGQRCMIPSGRMRFVVESAESSLLAKLERWAVRTIVRLEAKIDRDAEAELKRYLKID